MVEEGREGKEAAEKPLLRITIIHNQIYRWTLSGLVWSPGGGGGVPLEQFSVFELKILGSPLTCQWLSSKTKVSF